MKRTILPVALAILAFGISQVRSQEKEPQASWSSQNPGLIRLSLEFTKAIQRGDITTDDAQKLAARILGLPDSTIMFLARRYHKDRDFEALAADVEDQKKAMAPQTGPNLKANDLANCQIRGCGFYWGCFFNSRPSENCSIPANRYYNECLEGVLGPISQPKP